METSVLYALFRSDVQDAAAPYLWSDADVYSYIDDAQKMFCRLQGGIADATSSVTQIIAPIGAQFVPISPLILKIRQVYYIDESDRTVDLPILNFEDLQLPHLIRDYGLSVSSGYSLDLPGRVSALVSGMETNKLRLVGTPTVATTIKMLVYRMPLDEITSSSDELEIDEQHHRHLMLWMKHLAHMKQDAETYDKGRSDDFRQQFMSYCDQAKAERERREHKYRTVAYGGY